MPNSLVKIIKDVAKFSFRFVPMWENHVVDLWYVAPKFIVGDNLPRSKGQGPLVRDRMDESGGGLCPFWVTCKS